MSGAVGEYELARSRPISAVDRPGPAGSGAPGLAGIGGGRAAAGSGPLARALNRWRRALTPDRERPVPRAPAAVDSDGLVALARRLDDSGCAYGRVSAARLEQLTRAYDRLETKLNAVLMAVIGTFLSTLAGLFLYFVRGGPQ